MKKEIKEKIEKELASIRRGSNFKQSIIASLTYSIIWQCDLEDLEFLNIEWIARRLGISPSYITRCYRTVHDSTPHQLLVRRKMDLARKLLLECPDLSVSEIAAKLQYCSVNYFINVFARHNTLSPLQFRRFKSKEMEKLAVLKNLALTIQREINREIRAATGGKIKTPVNVHGGFGKFHRKFQSSFLFIAPGIDYGILVDRMKKKREKKL